MIVDRESVKAPQAVVVDYVDRSQAAMKSAPVDDEKKIFFDETNVAFNPVGITYEETSDVANLYNP